MAVWCGYCKSLVACEISQQLLPCFHIFCLPCLQKNPQPGKLCPMKNCYSSINLWSDIAGTACESKKCLRKLTPQAEVYPTACKHELCTMCWDEANRSESPKCPATDCGAPLLDEDQKEVGVCSGACGVSMDYLKLNIIPCCQNRMCSPCMEKWTEGKGRCPEGKCQPNDRNKKKRKKLAPAVRIPCSGQIGCEGEVLRQFPAEGECEHLVCVACLAKTLDECDLSNASPICPSESCRMPYRCDSVLALRALFPDRSAFFNRFELESHYSSEALKDDTVLHITDLVPTAGTPKTATPSKGNKNTLEIKVCLCEDEDNLSTVEFDLDGPLGDFLREIRRILKIMPWEKVYGYFRRDGAIDKQLDVRHDRIQLPLSSLHITKDTLIMVNSTGIVNSKVDKSSRMPLK